MSREYRFKSELTVIHRYICITFVGCPARKIKSPISVNPGGEYGRTESHNPILLCNRKDGLRNL